MLADTVFILAAVALVGLVGDLLPDRPVGRDWRRHATH
jgi:hypothetical protein